MPARAGIQIIVYGQRNKDDIAGVLRDVAEIGYDGAETTNLFRQEGDEGAVKALFEETGLALAGAHAGFAEFEDQAKLRENLHYCTSLGAQHLMCSGVGDRGRGLAAYRDACAVFNEAGKICQDAGVHLCYHNHAWEFEDREGDTRGIDVLLDGTDAAVVKFCVDVYWVYHGQDDPARFITANAERGVYYHFKDGERRPDGKARFLELGAGEVDLKAAYAAAAATNPAWITYEQDRTEKTPTESSRESLAYLRGELGL